MHDEEALLAERLRKAAEDAAGPPVPGPVARARRRLRKARRTRLAVLGAVTATVVLASLSLQNAAISRRMPPPRNEAAAPEVAGTQIPSTRPSVLLPEGTLSPGASLSAQPSIRPTTPAETGCPPLRSVGAPDGISVSLEVPKREVLSGEPVTMIVRVRNEGSSAVTWPRTTTQAYDFWVKRNDTVVWRWSRGRAFAPAVQTTTVQPGDESTHAEVWDQSGCPEAGTAFPAGPGRYIARALVLTAKGGWWSNPVEFLIR